MLSTAYYFLQVLLCSAIMMGYYWIVLRNKRFHQYNRFYLLSIAILSWIIPLIKIQWTNSFGDNEQVIRFLTVVADNNTELESVVKSKGFHWSTESLVSLLYFSVGIFLLMTMLHALYRIYQLLKKNPCRQIEDIFLIITQAKGTPFSFFRYIFWNDEIDIRSASGKQILQHELTHVQQRHSVDKMLIQLVLVVGWFNPFFWLLKKEMDMIHEFIADKRSVRDGDTAALAKMLLTAVYPQQQFELTHTFFFSPIKRRLQMLTNNKNPRFSYLRRLVVLPLLAVLVVLFAFRSKQSRIDNPISVASVVENVMDDFKSHVIGDPTNAFSAIPNKSLVLNKTYTIVVNPGHGGQDVGARGYDGTKESELSLSFAKKIKELNVNPNIKVVLTRETDVYNTVVQVAEMAEKFSPDLFISVHANNAMPLRLGGNKRVENPLKGVEIYIASKDKAHDYENNYQLANMLGNTISSVANPFLGIKSREKGIYVLQTLKCPSVLVETGFVSNSEELKLLKDESYQSKMALSILQGAELYLKQKEQSQNKPDFTAVTANNTEIFQAKKGDQNEDPSGMRDFKKRHPDVKQVYWRHAPLRMTVELKDGTEEVYNLDKADSKNRAIKKYGKLPIAAPPPPMLPPGKKDNNGQSQPQSSSSEQLVSSIQINSNGNKLVNTNSDTGKYRVEDVILEELYVETDVPPSFPGGASAWAKYLQRNLDADIVKRKGGPPGKYTVQITFIVDENGMVSTIRANDPGYGTKEEAIRMIAKGPNWKPGLVKGQKVNAQHKVSIVFTVV